MRRNKGYSLVELVVAVAVLMLVMSELGALMVNGATLYERGTMEVSLQQEAQQVILQVEDLMMGATRDIILTDTRVHGTVSSDVITIETHLYDYDHVSGAANGMKKVQYVIGLEFDVCEGTPPSDANYGARANDHSRLMMKRTVEGSSSTYAVMADGVRAIHMHTTTTTNVADDGTAVSTDAMTGYKNADMVVFQIEMQNHEYSYSSSKDIYLRNQPGTGGPSHDFQTQPKFKLELNVMRVHAGYNLQDAAPSADYKYFRFENPTTYGTVYTITGDHPSEGGAELTNVFTNNPMIKVNPSGLLGDWSKSVSCCVIQCSTSANFVSGDVKPIKVYTDAFEMNDMPLYARSATDSKTVRSVAPVYGVCLCSDCMKKMSMECQIYAEIPATYNGTTVDWYKTTMGLNGGIKRDRTASQNKIKNITIAKVDETDLPSTSDIKVKIPGDGATFEFNGGKMGDSNGKLWTQCESTYLFSIDQYGQSNAIVLRTENSTTKGDTYWKYLVKEFNGYVRIRVHCFFKTGVAGAADEFTEKMVNFYYYPMAKDDFTSGSTEFNKLWTHITANYRTDECEVDDGSGGGSGGGSSETSGTHSDLSISITGDATLDSGSYKEEESWNVDHKQNKVTQTIKVKWNGTPTEAAKRLGDITISFGKNVDYSVGWPGISGTGGSVTIHPEEWQKEATITLTWWV